MQDPPAGSPRSRTRVVRLSMLAAVAVGAMIVATLLPRSDRLGAAETSPSPSSSAVPARFAAAHPQCRDGRFTAQPDDAEVAAALMAGKVTLSPHRTTSLPADPRWSENPLKNANWVFQYHTLRWADVLRREGVRTANEAMLRRYRFLLEDWVKDNPYGAARSSFAWYDMAVGVRSVALVCAAQVDSSSWLLAQMTKHAQVLSNPREYRRTGNHALHQNMGLLALGCFRGVTDWQDLAIERTGRLLERSVDRDGVTDEGSTMYQYLNFLWYSEAKDRILACGRRAAGPFERIARMPTFLAYATKPDGTWVGFGDTDPARSAAVIHGTDAGYAATRGEVGDPGSLALFKIFKRGYAFSRSGWFTERPWTRESLATVRFGPPMSQTEHGHEDAGAVTFFAQGQDVLWSQGLWGGAGGPFRRFVIRNESHNVVDIDGASYRRDIATPLTATHRASTHHLMSIESRNLSGALWKRTVVHVLEPGFLIVDDVVTQRAARKVIQRWYVGADRTVALGGGKASTGGPGSDATFLWAGSRPTLSVVRGRRSPMVVGWRSDRANHIAPTPVIEAATKGTKVRLTTIIVPREPGTDPGGIRVMNTTTSPGAKTVEVAVGDAIYRIRWTSTFASVTRLD